MAQSTKPGAPEAATLRGKLRAALGTDFELVKDEMKTRPVERGGGTYWLGYVQPKRTGVFYLQYRYLESGPFEVREHEFRLRIGPEKCRRGPPASGIYERFCLGDTVIVPVLVNDYAGHEFKLAKAEAPNETPNETEDSPVQVPRPTGLDTAPVDNPAAPVLLYAGRGLHKLVHRIPGYTLTLYADFVAERPGRTNLLVSASGGSSGADGYDGVPVIVLPVGAPATFIAGREEVRGYRHSRDRREDFASWSSNLYMSNVLILQPGDRLTVGYFSVVRNSEDVNGRFAEMKRDPAEDLMPVINVRPFAPDLRYEFTEWIVDYLP